MVADTEEDEDDDEDAFGRVVKTAELPPPTRQVMNRSIAPVAPPTRFPAKQMRRATSSSSMKQAMSGSHPDLHLLKKLVGRQEAAGGADTRLGKRRKGGGKKRRRKQRATITEGAAKKKKKKKRRKRMSLAQSRKRRARRRATGLKSSAGGRRRRGVTTDMHICDLARDTGAVPHTRRAVQHRCLRGLAWHLPRGGWG